MIFSEIVAVGREILQGRVLDTNSNWIAIQLRNLGIRVRRILIIDDVKEEIEETVRNIILRKPKIAIFTGGLGPTFDDITISSFASAINVELVEDPKALDFISEMCAKRNLPLTNERRKMAFIPKGAIPLKNNVGMAPGVYMYYEDIHFFLLPGVPSEMKDIFEKEVKVRLEKLEGREYYNEIYIEILGIPESDLAPLIKKYKERYEPIYIKSHPRGIESGASRIILHLSVFTDKLNELNLLEEVKNNLLKELQFKAMKVEIIDSLR